MNQDQTTIVEQDNSASLIVDGGHLAHAMGSVIVRYAKRHNVNPKDIHVNIDLLLPEIERQLGLKFNLYQQFFYQGTSNGQPNDFHRRLRRNNITIGIHEMKIQHGKPVNKEGTMADPKGIAIVPAFIKAQKGLIVLCCFLLLAPVYSVLKLAILAFVAYMEIYHKVTFFDGFKPTESASQKASVWVEKGVDVQIGTKIIECAHGINGHSRSSKICVITGDSDLKSAFICASSATNMNGNIIVLSEKNCLAACLETYVVNKQVTLEGIMEECITAFSNEFLITPRVPAPALTPQKKTITTEVVKPITKKHKVVVAPQAESPNPPPVIAVPLLKPELKHNEESAISCEVALRLHKFIAVKWIGRPFFAIDMTHFYQDGNESLKAFIQKVKIRNICATSSDLLIQVASGGQIVLANSERSQNLENSYFVNTAPKKDEPSRESSYRSEPREPSYRNEPRESSFNGIKEPSDDDTQLLMRQLSVAWDGTTPVRVFLKEKKQILELLNLSVPATISSIKNCFPEEEPFQTCFTNFDTKYINTNYRSLSKLCKEIIQSVEGDVNSDINDDLVKEVNNYEVTEVEEVIVITKDEDAEEVSYVTEVEEVTSYVKEIEVNSYEEAVEDPDNDLLKLEQLLSTLHCLNLII